jgi:hypothetical protein
MRRVLAYLSGWAWRAASLWRGPAVGARAADESRQREARARFWAELREGQREAEQCARRNP